MALGYNKQCFVARGVSSTSGVGYRDDERPKRSIAVRGEAPPPWSGQDGRRPYWRARGAGSVIAKASNDTLRRVTWVRRSELC